jgi:hypothetical protein
MRKQSKNLSKKKLDQVITPGGPRPKDQVHSVKSGEAVRRNQDGTYSIVSTHKTTEKQ